MAQAEQAAEEDLSVLTDTQLVAWSRKKLQAALSRSMACALAGKTLEEYFAEEDLPTTVCTVLAADVREIGAFELDLPPEVPRSVKRHWVYRCRKERGKVYVLSWPNHMKLQQLGCVELEGLTDRDPEKRN